MQTYRRVSKNLKDTLKRWSRNRKDEDEDDDNIEGGVDIDDDADDEVENDYVESLRNEMGQRDLFEARRESIWKQLFNKIDENDVKKAYSKSNQVEDILKEMILASSKLKKRPEKKDFERMHQKLKSGKEKTENEAHFKGQIDLIAFRISVDSKEEMVETIQDLVEGLEKYEGFRHGFREDIDMDNPKKFYHYIYVYLPEVGYIAEVQIGHPFFFKVFERDSQIRREAKEKRVDYETYRKRALFNLRGQFYKDYEAYLNGEGPQFTADHWVVRFESEMVEDYDQCKEEKNKDLLRWYKEMKEILSEY